MAVADRRAIHLDTNYLIDVAAGRSPQVRRIEQWVHEGIAIEVGAVAWSEFLCGPLLDFELEYTRALVSTIVDFNGDQASLAADLFNLTQRRTRTHADCMIAAQAIRREAALATRNKEDFNSFTKYGLALA